MSLHDRIRDERSTDFPPTEPATIQAFDSLLGGIDSVKLNVYFALRHPISVLYPPCQSFSTHLGVPFNFDMLNWTIFRLTLSFDILSQIFIPVRLGFPEESIGSLVPEEI